MRENRLPIERPVILGLWPIAGITTVGVTAEDARATIRSAIECGIRWFDTAYSYGFDGESDRLLGEAIRGDRDRYGVIGKVGQRWSADRQRVVDASPATLIRDAEDSLRRLGIEQFDLLMLHQPDPSVPLERSAETIAQLKQRGLCRATGICNVNVTQRRQFATQADCEAIQCPLNLIQRRPAADLIPDCRANQCDVHVYWTLMKGLLSGRIGRDHQFAEGDSRPGYQIYQGESRRRAHQVIDQLLPLAFASGITMAQLAIGWTLSQPGVTAALVGARRPEQIIETASSAPLPTDLIMRIDAIVDAVFGPIGGETT